MAGFINIRIGVLVRRAITMIPAIAVLAAGMNPANALVLSQVVLSFGIPFALIPLVVLTSRRDVMGVHVNRRATTTIAWGCAAIISALNVSFLPTVLHELRQHAQGEPGPETGKRPRRGDPRARRPRRGARTLAGHTVEATEAVIASTNPDPLYGRLLRPVPGVPEGVRKQAAGYRCRRAAFRSISRSRRVRASRTAASRPAAHGQRPPVSNFPQAGDQHTSRAARCAAVGPQEGGRAMSSSCAG